MSSEIWRHRLADMLVEHFTPFEHVAGFPYERWIEELRNPAGLRIELSDHSMVFQHDEGLMVGELRIEIDEDRQATDRRPLLQWLIGKPQITSMLLNLPNSSVSPIIDHPTSLNSATPESDGTGIRDGEIASDAPAPQPSCDPHGSSILENSDRLVAQEEASVGRAPPSFEAEPAAAPIDSGGARPSESVPSGRPCWLSEVEALALRLATHSSSEGAKVKEWLDQQVSGFRQSLQAEGATVEIQKQWLTPNADLLRIKGSKSLTIDKLEKQRNESQDDPWTRHHSDCGRARFDPDRLRRDSCRPKVPMSGLFRGVRLTVSVLRSA